MKTEGQIAFEAYVRAGYYPSSQLVWEKLPAHVQRAWEVAATFCVQNGVKPKLLSQVHR